MVFRNSNHRLRKTDNGTCWQKSHEEKSYLKIQNVAAASFCCFYNSSYFTNLPKFMSLFSLQTNKLSMLINDSATARCLCAALLKHCFLGKNVGGGL